MAKDNELSVQQTGTTQIFQVHRGNQIGNRKHVDLSENNTSCSCGHFQIHGLPCEHMMACARIARIPSHKLAWPVWNMGRHRQFYSGFVIPLTFGTHIPEEESIVAENRPKRGAQRHLRYKRKDEVPSLQANHRVLGRRRLEIDFNNLPRRIVLPNIPAARDPEREDDEENDFVILSEVGSTTSPPETGSDVSVVDSDFCEETGETDSGSD